MAINEKLIQAIQSQKIDDARDILKQEENIPDNPEDFKNVPVFDILLKTKAFDIIDLFIEKDLIETDVYEYDDLERSFFSSMLKILGSDEESVKFTEELLPKLSNINDAVNNQTLLGLALSLKATPAIVEALIKGGCDVNYVNNAENTYLHQVANNYIPEVDLVAAYTKIFIDNGANVNAANIVKDTPLMAAISRDKKGMAEMLLENGARANEQNKEGKTAYYMAVVDQVSHSWYELLKKFESPDFDKKTTNGITIFFEFLNRTSSSSATTNDLLRAMIEDGADLFQTSAHYSIEKTAFDILAGKPAEVFELVLKASGADVLYADNDGSTLLHKVAAYDVNYDQNAARDTYKKAKLLLEMGADTNATNNKDETPLMIASTDNLKVKTVELLLQHSK